MKATLVGYFEDEPATPIVPPTPRKKKPVAKPNTFPPDMDILLWVSLNEPRDLDELKAIRYALYHRCSRNDFKVSEKEKEDRDDFRISRGQAHCI